MELQHSDLRSMFPRGRAEWIDALVALGPDALRDAGIETTNHLRHFFAQCAAETDGLSLKNMRENINYRPQRILEVFDYRIRKAQRDNPQFRGKSLAEIAAIIAASPALMAETVYGNRPDIGNTVPGDGIRFIGRGPTQTTGREWYAKLSAELGVDLVSSPALLEQPDLGWKAALAEWRLLGLSAIADTGSVDRVSRKLNGGTNGQARRRQEYARALHIWPENDTIETITPRHADAPPPAVTASTLVSDGSRSMSWLGQLKAWVTASGLSLSAFLGLDSLGSFRNTLDELKLILADHALVIFLGLLGAVLAAVLVAQHFLVVAAREGRYQPRQEAE